MSKKILIVDDHPFIINGLESIISGFEEYTLAGKANNGKEAISIIESHQVDIVFTDIEMSEMNGLELISHLNQHYPSIKVVVLTMHSHHWMIKRILKLDVSAILSKSASDADFRNAIKAITTNEKYYDSSVQSVLEDITDQTTHNNEVTVLSFTQRELEILELIYDGLTTKQMSEKLHKSVNTIESHRKNLFIKCGVKNVASLLKFAMNKGFVGPKGLQI